MVTAKFVLVFVLVVVTASCVYGGGDYVPKSYYVIDHFGHQSQPVYVRSKRDLMNIIPLFRVKRGGGGSASSGSYASAGSSANAGAGAGAPVYFNEDQIANLANPEHILGQVQNLINNIPGGPASGHSSGGLGAGQQAGYQGPVLFSRFGEAQGTGVHVSGQAQGPNAAFSSSSSSVDDQGKIKYSVQSGKY